MNKNEMKSGNREESKTRIVAVGAHLSDLKREANLPPRAIVIDFEGINLNDSPGSRYDRGCA